MKAYFQSHMLQVKNQVMQRKSTFLVLFLLQVLVVVSLGSFALLASQEILPRLQEVLQTVGSGNTMLSESFTLAPGLLLSFQQLEHLLKRFLLQGALLFLTLQALLWVMSHHLLHPTSWKTKGQQAVQFLVSGFLFLTGMTGAGYVLLREQVLSPTPPPRGVFITFCLLWYFLFLVLWTSLPLSLKGSRQVLRTTLKHLPTLISAFLLSWLVLLPLGALTFFLMSSDQFFSAGVLSGLLFLLFSVIARLWFISCTRGIHETDTH